MNRQHHVWNPDCFVPKWWCRFSLSIIFHSLRFVTEFFVNNIYKTLFLDCFVNVFF